MLKQALLSRLYKWFTALDFATTALQSVRQTHNKNDFQQACMQQIASPISEGFFARVKALTTKITCCEETRITQVLEGGILHLAITTQILEGGFYILLSLGNQELLLKTPEQLL